MPNEFVLYGATGYTAGLIIDLAGTYGLTPILAGRNKDALKALAKPRGLTYRVADLENDAELDYLLEGQTVVLHCAGPFVHTSLPMQRACLRTGTHYLDITGEIKVFQQGEALHNSAFSRNLMFMSGVGFDVVPTDCLALQLKNKLPDATHLELAFANKGGTVSVGTALTAVENLGAGGQIREDGLLTNVPLAHRVMNVTFADGEERPCMAIPWGDVATAYHTTGIPNIETFMAASQSAILGAKAARFLNGFLSKSWLRKLARQRIRKTVTGPDARMRQTARSLVWGRVQNAEGRIVSAQLDGPEGYTLTAHTALLITRHVLNGRWEPGYQTPAAVYGPDLILDVPGTTRSDV